MTQQPTQIWINQKAITLKPSQLIQSGGEGMVFRVQDTAVKLYHLPHNTQVAKLNQWLTLSNHTLPNHVLAPCQLVTNQQKNVIGYQMPLLPTPSFPFKKLSQPPFWPQNAITTPLVLTLLQHAHTTLAHLHKIGFIVGDLNDRNLFFTLPNHTSPTTWWIDVDSYQFGRFPCPVAQQDFLDPTLYHITNFSQRPTFTQRTDWYAYTVLLVKSLLQLHPYGGTHHQYKSLLSRAQAQISILNTAVTLPQRARPLESLTDDLLHHLHRLFDKGERVPLPAQLLQTYAHTLHTCPSCGLSYPRQRSHCPRCTHQITVPPLPSSPKTLFTIDGFIEQIAIQPSGRLLVITRQEQTYKLTRLGIGGRLNEITLFNGQAGYRCAIFGNQLVVNPPHKQQLLILDISGSQPQRTAMIETAAFHNQATFATTPTHLYRIAQGWIMRGNLQNGHYVEDTVATAHRHQTRLFGSPYSNIIAGYHRIFTETHFFLIDGHGHQYDLPVPQLVPGQSLRETAVVFSQNSVAIIRHIHQQTQLNSHSHLFSLQGTPLYHHVEPAETATITANHYPYTSSLLHPRPPFSQPQTVTPIAPDTRLHQHPQGLILQHPTYLQFAP